MITAAEESANSYDARSRSFKYNDLAAARRRQRDVRDQIARLEHGFALRRVARQQKEFADRNAPLDL